MVSLTLNFENRLLAAARLIGLLVFTYMDGRALGQEMEFDSPSLKVTTREPLGKPESLKPSAKKPSETRLEVADVSAAMSKDLWTIAKQAAFANSRASQRRKSRSPKALFRKIKTADYFVVPNSMAEHADTAEFWNWRPTSSNDEFIWNAESLLGASEENVAREPEGPIRFALHSSDRGNEDVLKLYSREDTSSTTLPEHAHFTSDVEQNVESPPVLPAPRISSQTNATQELAPPSQFSESRYRPTGQPPVHGPVQHSPTELRLAPAMPDVEPPQIRLASRLQMRESQGSENKLLNANDMTGRLDNVQGILSRLDSSNDFVARSTLADEARPRSTENMEWMPNQYTWASPVFHHKPLYFEQPNLERYGLGRSRLVQTVYSPAHFFGSIALVPYKSLTQHPLEKVYSLGQSRPGNCVPVQKRVWLGQSSFGEARWFWAKNSGYR